MPTRKQVLLEAHAAGFRVSPEGVLLAPDGKPRSITLYQKYPSFNFKCEGVWFHLHLHRLAAYCKFGEVMFEVNILIRHHPDASKHNCRWDNLLLGTPVHNWDDNAPEVKERMLANLRPRKAKSPKKKKKRIRISV